MTNAEDWLEANVRFYRTEEGGFADPKHAWPLRMKLFFEGDPVGYGVVVVASGQTRVNPGDVVRVNLLIIEDGIRARVIKQRPAFLIGDTRPRGSGSFV